MSLLAALAAFALLIVGIAAPSASADDQIEFFAAGDAPAGVAFLPDGSLAYISSSATDAVTVVNFATRSVIDAIAVGDSPAGLKVLPDGSQVWVTNSGAGAGGNTVSVIDTADFNVIATIAVGVNPVDIAFTPDGATAYVVNSGSNSVSKISVATRTVVATITVAGTPTAVAVSPDGASLWVTQSANGTVVQIGVLSNLVSTPVAVGTTPVDLIFAPGPVLYVANKNSKDLSVLVGGAVVATINTINSPQALEIPGDGRVLYVALPDVDGVAVVSLASRQFKYFVSVGDNPVAIAANNTPGAEYVAYVASKNDNGITVVGLSVDRMSGSTRYDVALKIAKKNYPTGAAKILIATGENYPDALSAGPVAAKLDAPLLLTPGGSLDPAVAAYISATSPTAEIAVVGGPNSVSANVFAQLDALTSGPITRKTGATRYEASRNIVRFGFLGAATVYITTGRNFPDALSAGTTGAPVILVDGAAQSVDTDTLALLSELGVLTVKIAGGPNSVSPAIMTQLQGAGYTVIRLGGATRYEASIAINSDAYGGVRDGFLATGLKFPDALAATPWAGRLSAPLWVVPSDCIPSGLLEDFMYKGINKVHLVGGEASLTSAVAGLVPCS
jgi:YVTN family beta-propeller protein